MKNNAAFERLSIEIALLDSRKAYSSVSVRKLWEALEPSNISHMLNTTIKGMLYFTDFISNIHSSTKTMEKRDGTRA